MGRWKNLFSWEGIKQAFDWTPVAVKTPRPCYKTYKDVGRLLLGYEVEVTYLYHGVRKQLFPIDEEKLGLVTQKKALKNAIIFYKKTRNTIREKQKS